MGRSRQGRKKRRLENGKNVNEEKTGEWEECE
jgi:hypothetical protein